MSVNLLDGVNALVPERRLVPARCCSNMRDREQPYVRVGTQDSGKKLGPAYVEGPEHVLDEGELPEGSVHLVAGMIEFGQVTDVWKLWLYGVNLIKKSSVVGADVPQHVE